MQNILVIGGCGFIGSQVVKRLKLANYYPIIFDNLSTGDQRTTLGSHLIVGDLQSVDDLKNVFHNFPIKAVIHLAASIEVGESVSAPIKYYKNNLVNTLNLLETMHQFGVKNFIFSSTASVYGIPQFIPMSESHPLLPINPYGQTKLMVEKILEDIRQAYDFNYIALRYFNAAGGDPDGIIKNYQRNQANIFPRILKSLKLSTPFTIHGTDYATPDGTCLRDYIHVDDLALAHIQAMEFLFENGRSRIYNLGNGTGFSVRDVVRAAEKVTGIKAYLIEGSRRAGDPPILVADATLAKKELDWTPQIPDLESMIDHAWTALSENCYTYSE